MVQNNAALVLELLNTILLSFGGNFFDFSCGNNLRIDGMRFSPSWRIGRFVLYDERKCGIWGEGFRHSGRKLQNNLICSNICSFMVDKSLFGKII